MNENNFQKQYSASSQKIKDFLISEELTEITKNIVVLTKLNINQTTQLTEIVSNVLIGKTSLDDFSKEIELYLKTSSSQIRIITRLVNKKIFEQFGTELEQYKSRLGIPEKQRFPEFQEPKKATTSSQKPRKKTSIKETRPKQVLPEQIIPEYSFPEPSEVKIEKPISKTEGLKRVVTPIISSEQQEKIRGNLLAAMQKKESNPKILEEMKKVFFKKPIDKKIEQKKTQRSTIIEPTIPSKVLGGGEGKFKDEESFVKTDGKKPYILDVKLKEEPLVTKAMEDKERKEKTSQEEPIPYKKYQKKNPFGQA